MAAVLKHFEIPANTEGSVTAKCKQCTQIIAGSTKVTSISVKHLKSILEKYIAHLCLTVRALVFVCHGVGEHCQWYDCIAEPLKQHGLLAYSHDHVGHGLSEGDRVHIDSMDEYYNDVKQHTEQMKQKYPNLPVYIMGHSMGGTVTVGTVLRNPDMFQGMVLLGPALKPNPETASPIKVAAAKVASRLAPQLSVGSVDSRWISRNQEIRDQYDADPLVNHGGVKAKWGYLMLLAMAEIEKRMPEIKLPFLILHGDEDKLCLIDGSTIMQEKARSQDKTLSVYEGGYHQLHHEPDGMAERCINEITEWIVSRVSQGGEAAAKA